MLFAATGGVGALAVVTTIALVGIDCAAPAKNTGLAYAIPEGGKLAVQGARCASNDATASSIVRAWVRDARDVLWVLDAPLGWPAAFSRALASHRAGEPLGPAAHLMFRRLTDDLICERLGKRPLEVAADRSARAAHAACGFWTSSDNLWLNLWLQIRLCAPLVGTVDWERSRCSLRSHVSRWACRKAAVRCLGLDSLESLRNQTHSPHGRVGQEARLETDLWETQTAL